MLLENYQNILYFSRPISKRNPMAVDQRAKQFAPFAALKGLEQAVREKEVVYEPRRILPKEKKDCLDMKLKMLKPGTWICVEYFEEHPQRPGYGRYHTVEGNVDFFDPFVYLRIGDIEIRIPDIYEISGDVFEVLELPC